MVINKEKVFNKSAKAASILSIIFIIVAIIDFSTSFISIIPGVGMVISIIKSRLLGKVSSLFVPALVFTILGFKGDKSLSKKTLTRLIIGKVFFKTSIILSVILKILSKVLIVIIVDSSLFTFMF